MESDYDSSQLHSTEALNQRFTELYQKHLREIYSYAFYRLGNHHDAEDLAEQTFLQAYRHLERALAEAEGRSLRPWLIRIAHNLISNHYRDRARHPTVTIDGIQEASAQQLGPQEWLEAKADLEQLLSALNELPSQWRDALIMRSVLQMNNQEIATALGRSLGSTKVLIHRATTQLRREVRSSRGSDD